MKCGRFSLIAVAFAGVLAASCDEQRTAAPGNSSVRPEYDKAGRLTLLTSDRNGDGKIDTWGYMDGARVVRIEVDEDGDGKVDRWEYHGTGAGCEGAGCGGVGEMDAPNKTLERIERATRHDGQISRREVFDQGELTTVEEDTDGDGKFDKWETYSDGSLSTMAFDSRHRGTPDRRLIYRPDGSLDRIETDPAGTGRFEPVTP